MSTHPSAPAGPGLRRCVVAGGSGAVGRLFTAVLADAGLDVCAVDPEAPLTTRPDVRLLKGDITAPDDALRAELAGCDLLVLAVPEPVALDAVGALAGLLPHSALLADTLSVKSRIAAAVTARLPEHQAVGLNPMFAPALGLPGRPVAAVVLRDGPLAEELLGLVAGGGGRVVRMDAERHDRLAAASQALTHATVLAFGQALAELGADIGELTAVAPPPHTTLLALLARIASGTPEVYWDIQSANPYAERARAALAHGVDGLRDLARDGDEQDFERQLHRLAGVFGDRLDHFGDVCAGLFTALPALSPADPEENT
ncbi:prephenate dehydrogenase/arogenate dehydrogenase family protein [Streptomyces sp. NPDC059378]|uniref:prephenate dehydrogenase/arogenate dehydrogenase family protein n=1 Tax=Streptomyces sp. NPDC059378 TaxID=3346815 RepID=UPI00368E17B5